MKRPRIRGAPILLSYTSACRFGSSAISLTATLLFTVQYSQAHTLYRSVGIPCPGSEQRIPAQQTAQQPKTFCSRTPAYHGSGELSGERSSGGICLTKVLVSCDPMSHGYISMEIRLLKHNLDWPASQKQTEPTLSKQLLARPVTYRPPALRQYDLIGQICQVGDIRYPLRPSTRQSARRSGHIDPQVSVHP